jgi:alpha-1,6-mannosyltransferase
VPALPLTRRRATSSTAVIAVVGYIGSALVARASYVVGTLPGDHLDVDVATGPYRWVFEIGVGLLVLAWLALGHLVLDETITGMTRRVWWAGAAMAAPLLVAAPVTSQDVWAYLGQANVAAHGLDPYSVGPASVQGPYADGVATAWLHSPSPYGPLWLWICRLVVAVSHPHPWAACSSSAHSPSSGSRPPVSPSPVSPDARAPDRRWGSGWFWPDPSPCS